MSAYDRIQEAIGFEIPNVYRRLRENGIIYDIVLEEWAENWEDWALSRPLSLLNHPDGVEWLTLDQIAQYKSPNYWRDDLTFIPFAENGSGDSWCWFPKWEHKGDTPVVFTPHDVNGAQGIAPSFEGFLFRLTLETLECTYPEDLSAAEVEESIKKEVGQLKGYLRPEWHRILAELVSREFHLVEGKSDRYVDAYWAFCPRDEVKAIVERELAFPHLDETFAHMNLAA